MHGAAFVLVVLAYVGPVILVVGGLIALYWVIRRGVAAGIRDARPGPSTNGAEVGSGPEPRAHRR